MKILHINCNYMATSLHQTMVEHLDEYTDNVVFCPLRKGGITNVEPNSNVITKECFSLFDRPFFFLKQKRLRREIEQSIDIESFDLIHAYTLFTDGNLAMNLSAQYKIPYVVAIRNTDMNDFFRVKPYLISRGIRIMEHASNVFFLSEAYRRDMMEHYITPSKKSFLNNKISVIPNGIDDFWLLNRYYDRDFDAIDDCFQRKHIKLIYVGSVDKNKNIDLTIKALHLLEDEGWTVQFDVIGPVNDFGVLRHIEKNTNVTYTEKMPKEELINRYRSADIFVMPSHRESFGLVYAEAMSQGLPVIYTRGQGFDGHFREGLIGYSVNSENAIELKQRILDIVADYKSISERCLECVCGFSWRKITFEYTNIYNQIVSKMTD